MACRGPIWEYFSISTSDESRAICKLCEPTVVLSRGGKSSKTFTTSGLINHLKNKHPEQHAKYTENVSEKKDLANTIAASSSKRKTPQVQLSVLDNFKKMKVWDINDSRAKIIHYRIGEMIAVDNQPFTIVEDLGFNRLLNCLEKQYKIPSRRYFSDVIIPDIYDRTHKAIKALLTDVGDISLTSDVWTCNNTNESFISLSAHWLTEDFIHKSTVLNCKHFSGRHTAEAIALKFEDIFDEWDIKKNSIHVLLRDNGRNMVAGAREAGIPNDACFIHTLQLVIHDAILEQRAVIDILAKCRQIVTHFNHSPLACTKFKQIQTELLLPQHVLIQDVPTRWNSTLHMLARLNEQKRTVGVYGADHDIPTLTAHQWSLVENIIRLLQPFNELTLQASATLATIAMVIPSIATLQRYLAKEQKDSGVQTMKTALLDSLNERFHTIEFNQVYVLATALDPRYKLAFYSSNAAREQAKQALMQAMIKEASQSDPTQTQTQSVVEANMPASLSSDIHEDLWDCYSEIAASGDQSTPSTSTTGEDADLNNKIKIQLENYLASKLLNRKEDPLLWWKANRELYPELSKLARRFLSAPASSVYSEQMFSEAGKIYEDKRSRLLPRNAERLLFLNYNLPLLDFKY